MSGQKIFFLSGANAKIKVNGRTIAFCTNISYSINVNHETPVILGMYEGSSVEPLSYKVSGSFSVIRYIAGIASDSGKINNIEVKDSGNGIGAWGPSSTGSRIKGGLTLNASKADGRVYDNLDPSSLEKGTTFDIEIHQKYSNNRTHAAAKIRNCRIVGADFNLATKTVGTETFRFTALYADEDSFLADFSGLGQHLG